MIKDLVKSLVMESQIFGIKVVGTCLMLHRTTVVCELTHSSL